MSPEVDIIITAEKKDISVTIEPLKATIIETPITPDVLIVAAGNVGPPGPAGKWKALTQDEYDLLSPPDPDILYVIIQ